MQLFECPDDGFSIGSDGLCVACARTLEQVLADREERSDDLHEFDPSDLAETVVPAWQTSRIARYSRELAERSDAERAELDGAPSVNAGAYAPDAIPLGAHCEPIEPVDGEPSTEWLMRGPKIAGGHGGSNGRARPSRRPLICGEPCDCGGGLPCRTIGPHASHVCEECRRGSATGRPRKERGRREVHVTGRISKETACAIATINKSTATIMYELGRAILEGRLYDPHA